MSRKYIAVLTLKTQIIVLRNSCAVGGACRHSVEPAHILRVSTSRLHF